MSRGSFNKDDERAREAGRKGGEARARLLRAQKGETRPYTEPFLTFRDAVGLGGPTRRTWTMIWKAADALAPDEDELQLYRQHTGRDKWPSAPARECWVCGGRRGEKTGQVVGRATHRAISTNWHDVLSAGELGLIVTVAADRDQARNSLSRLKGLVRHPLVAPYVRRVLRDSVEFSTGCTVRVATCSFRTIRGYTLLDAVLEECAFYRDESSANPDEEILAAIRPALLTVPGARVYGVSSPYWRRGILWKAYEAHWGRDDSDILVFNASSLALNPTLNPAAIAREFEDDPARAASEYGTDDGRVTFRSDVETFLTAEAVAAVVVPGRFELPPVADTRYIAFCDPAGGSGGDSFALAIAHRQDEIAVLDLIRETRPPFSPSGVVEGYAELLLTYSIRDVVGDRFAGEFPRELFRQRGIEYRTADKTKSDYYREALPLVNSGRAQLLDHLRLRAQLLGLERRVSRAGKDSIDHAPKSHDDLANVAMAVLVLSFTASAVSGWCSIGGITMNLLSGEAGPGADF